MYKYNILFDNRPFYFETIDVILNGEKKEIVLALTPFTMKSQAKIKSNVYKNIAPSMVLPTTLCITKPEVFTNEGEKLFTLYGDVIPSGIDFGFPVYAYLDKSDNRQLLAMEGLPPFSAEVVDCTSVKDAISKIAASNTLSQIPNNGDWTRMAGAADNTMRQISIFAEKHKMSIKAAQNYFNVDVSTTALQKIAIYNRDSIKDSRSEDEAEELFAAMIDAFGARDAKQTSFIKAINKCVNDFNDFELVTESLTSITPEDKVAIDAESCKDRVACITRILTSYIMEVSKIRSTTEIS